MKSARKGVPPGAILRWSRGRSMGAHLSTGKVKRIQQLLKNWLPRVASRHLASPKVASLASRRESTPARSWFRKPLIWLTNSGISAQGAFRLASPVKTPHASEPPRCAPPHTFWAGEEPEEGTFKHMRWTW